MTRNHRVILPADGNQQRHQIGRGNELNEQQAELPVAFRLFHTAESRSHRNAHEKPGRYEARHRKYHHADGQQDRHRRQREERRQRGGQQIFYLPFENDDQESRQQQRQQQVQERLGKNHPEDILSRRTVAFMYGHLLGAADQRRNHDQYIIEDGDGDQDDRHENEHVVHVLHLLIIIVDVLQRRDGVRQVYPGFLQAFHILVALLHPADGGGEPVGIGAGE